MKFKLTDYKITKDKNILRDFKELLKGMSDIPRLRVKSKLPDGPREILHVDFGYSTRLGYSKQQLETAIAVLNENVAHPEINTIFGTNYTAEELDRAILYISNNAKIKSSLQFEEGNDTKEADFVFLNIVFEAVLYVNKI